MYREDMPGFSAATELYRENQPRLRAETEMCRFSPTTRHSATIQLKKENPQGNRQIYKYIFA